VLSHRFNARAIGRKLRWPIGRKLRWPIGRKLRWRFNHLDWSAKLATIFACRYFASGEYQIGDDQARSRITGGTTSESCMPN
jgi:hypothetical protein